MAKEINESRQSGSSRLFAGEFLPGRQPFCKKSKSKWLAQESAQDVWCKQPGREESS
jgi:hypothetical protein